MDYRHFEKFPVIFLQYRIFFEFVATTHTVIISYCLFLIFFSILDFF